MKKLVVAVLVATMMSTLAAAPAQATYEDRAAWVAWFNVQDAYFRCTANVSPPDGFYWVSNCLMAPYYYDDYYY